MAREAVGNSAAPRLGPDGQSAGAHRYTGSQARNLALPAPGYWRTCPAARVGRLGTGCGHSLFPSPSATSPSTSAHPSSGPRAWPPPPGRSWVPISLLRPLGASRTSSILQHKLEPSPTTLKPCRPVPPPTWGTPVLCVLAFAGVARAWKPHPSPRPTGLIPKLTSLGGLPHCQVNPLQGRRPGTGLAPHPWTLAECLGRGLRSRS